MTPGFFANCKQLATVLAMCLLVTLTACASPEEKAQAHLERGLELLDQGEYAKAGLEFRNAIKFNEKLTSAWVGLSKVDERKPDWAAMNTSLTRALELDPNQFEPQLRMGKLLLIVGNIDKALVHINKANELNKDNSDALAARAAALLRLRDREGSRKDAERALAINTENVDAYAVLATDSLIDNDFKNALLFIDRGLATDEKNLALLLLKLRVFEQQADDPQLEAVLRTLLSFYPEKIAFRRALIAMLTSRNRPEEAEKEMRALAATNPEDPAAGLDLVRFVGRFKGADAVRRELEALIADKPSLVDYKIALAEFDFAQKRPDEAKSSLQTIIAKSEPAEDVRRAQLSLARIHLALKEADQASKLIADVLDGDAKNVDALALRASIRIDANDIDNAVADLREALSQQPQSVPVLRLLGRALERQGSVELAEDRYGQAVTLANYNPAIAIDYVSFLLRRGKSKEAEQVLVEAVGRTPNDRRLLTSLARLRLDQQDWAGAEEVAQALKKLGDNTGVSDQILGAVQLGQQKFDQSIETFRNIYNQSQGTARPMLSLVMAYARAGKTAEAESFLKSVLEANENNAEALVLAGSLKTLEKKPEEAEAAFKLAIERQPTNPVGYRALANHYLVTQRTDQSVATLKTGRDKTSGDTALGLMLASLLESRRDIEAAIAIYEDILVKNPGALIVINNLASLLADYRGDEASLARARDLSHLLKSTESPYFKDTLGWVAYRRGEFQAALGYLKEAAEKLPNLNLVRYHLGMTHKALEQPKEAKTEFGKALELTKEDDPLREKIQSALASLPVDNTAN